MRRGAVLSCAIGVILAVAGCSGNAPAPIPAPSDTPRSQDSSDAPSVSEDLPDDPAPDKAAGVSVDIAYLGTTVHLEIAPVQVKDGAALLSIDYSLGADAPSPPSIAIGSILKPPTGPMGVSAIRLIDVGNAQVHLVGRDAKKQPVTTREALALTPGKSVHSDAFFAAPTGDTVDVLFPYFGLVQNVPVEQASGPLPMTPVDLGRAGTIEYQTAPIDTFVVAFDDSSASRVTGKDVTVSLASDVLFAVDKSTLTAKARKVIDRAAKKIAKVSSGGEVSVIGHTDDVGTDGYNQKLSLKRAQSVVGQLSKGVGEDFALKASGRGESEPAVDGHSAQARAGNRRVEIRFQAKTAGSAIDVGESGATAPKPKGPVVPAGSPVSVTVREKGFSIDVLSVRRVGSYLVGSLRVDASAPGPIQMLELFGTANQGLAAGRGLKMTTLVAGAHNLTLLGEGSRYYPADYVTEAGAGRVLSQRATLADQFLASQVDQGRSVVVTAMWPDPGGDTVTIDVPDRFRITDVPVTP